MFAAPLLFAWLIPIASAQTDCAEELAGLDPLLILPPQWEAMTENALAVLVEQGRTDCAKLEVQLVEESAHTALQDELVDHAWMEALLERSRFTWSLADKLEDGWSLLEQGQPFIAKAATQRLNEAVRAAGRDGRLSSVQVNKLLVMSSDLWSAADGLKDAQEGLNDGFLDAAAAHSQGIVREARGWHDQRRIADLQLGVVEERAGTIETSAELERQRRAQKRLQLSADDVPYLCQHDNDLFPDSSGQNTAVAMLLRFYGVTITADQITRDRGKDRARHPEGLAEVFNHYAIQAGISMRLAPQQSDDLEAVDAQLRSGKPTIVHGLFSPGGHAVLVFDRDDYAYMVHDPGGAWSGVLEGGYALGAQSGGRGAQYSLGAFREAVATLDGLEETPVLWQEVYQAEADLAQLD